MRGQLEHLIELSQRPNVTIQIIPFQAGGHAVVGGSFSLLHFAEHDLPDVVYLEQLHSAQYLDKPDTVAAYQGAMDLLCSTALNPASSRELLRSALRRA